MILTWNGDDTAQLYEGIGKSAWNWSGPAGSAAQATGRLEYTIPFGLMEYTVKKAVETTLAGHAEHTVETP